MKRRGLLIGAGAAALTLAIPRRAFASSSVDAYYNSAFDRIVAPVCMNLVRPTVIERDDTSPYWYTKLNAPLGRTEISYARGAPVPGTDYEALHETGHAFAILLGQQYRGGNWIRDFLAYHGATLPDDDLRLSEIFAEHFAAAMGMPLYLGYPAYKGLVPFRLAADTRAWIAAADRASGPVPPVDGAELNAASADRKQLVWIYRDGSVHTWVNGMAVR